MRLSNLVIGIFIFLIVLNFNFTNGLAIPSGYNYLRQENVKQTNTTTILNVPYLVNSSFFNTKDLISANKMRYDCKDLRLFNQNDNNQLPYDFESYDDAVKGCNAQETLIWAIANISVDNTTYQRWYYGNPSETTWGNSSAIWNNAVAVFHFGEGSGTTTKVKTSNATSSATLNGVNWVNLTNGKFGYSVFSSTSTNYIVTTNNFYTASPITVEAWIYPLSVTTCSQATGIVCEIFGTESFGSNPGGFIFYLDAGTSKLHYVWRNAGGYYEIVSTSTLTTNTWYHISATHSGSTVKLFINGKVDKIENGQTSQTSDTSPIRIFKDGGGESERSTLNGYVDEVRIWNEVKSEEWIMRSYQNGVTERMAILQPEQNPPQITIFSPSNTTYFYLNNFQFNFKAIDDDSSTFQLKAYLDGNLIYDNSSYQNNTEVSLIQNLSQAKQYNFTVWANDTQGATTNFTVIFTIKDFEIETIEFSSIVYETSTQNVSIIYRINNDLINNINSILFWNTTGQGTQDYQTKNSTHIKNIKSINIPLIQTNDTTIDFYFESTIIYENMSEKSDTSSSNTQHIIFSIAPSSLETNSDEYAEGDTIETTFTFNIFFNNANANKTVNISYETQSYQTQTFTFISGTEYEVIKNFTTSNNNENVSVKNVTAKLTISYGGKERTQEINKQINLYKIILYSNASCSASNNIIHIQYYDEKTRNPITTNATITFLLTNGYVNRTFSIIKNNENTNYICLIPSFARPYANITLLATSSGYYFAAHYPYTTTYLQPNSSLSLYLVSNENSESVIFTLPRSDYILYVEKYFDGIETSYIRSSKADFNKKALIYLNFYETQYKIKVYTDNQQLCFQSSLFRVTSNEYSISSCSEGTLIFPSTLYESNINITCSFSNETKKITCDFITNDNLNHQIIMKVYRLTTPFGMSLYDEQSIESVSGSLISDELEEGFIYEYVVEAHSEYEYLRGTVNLVTLITSTDFMFFIFTFFVLISVVGIFNPFVSLVMTISLLVVLTTLNLISLVSTAIAGIVILYSVALILIER